METLILFFLSMGVLIYYSLHGMENKNNSDNVRNLKSANKLRNTGVSSVSPLIKRTIKIQVKNLYCNTSSRQITAILQNEKKEKETNNHIIDLKVDADLVKFFYFYFSKPYRSTSMFPLEAYFAFSRKFGKWRTQP